MPYRYQGLQLIRTAAVAALLLALPATALAQVTPTGQLGLRYRGFFVVDGPESQLYDNRPETDVRLGARLVDRDLLLQADLVVAVGDGGSPTQRWTLVPGFGGSDPVHVDTAALAWGIDAVPDLRFTVGRAAVPWVHRGLVWDEDVRLPMVRADFVRDGKPGDTVDQWRFHPAYIYLSPGTSAPDDEVWAVAGEFGLTVEGDGHSLDLDLGTMHLFGHRQLGRAIARGEVRVGPHTAGFTRNTTPTDAHERELEVTQRLVRDGLASRFHTVNLRLRYAFELTEDTPGALELELVYNAGADAPGDELPLGVVFALIAGEADRPGEGEIALEGVYIGADATLDLFNRDLWGTNVVGGGFRGAFVAWKGLTVAFETLVSLPADDELRALGQARGEVGEGDELAVQIHASAVYGF